jgi:hypothetical protein
MALAPGGGGSAFDGSGGMGSAGPTVGFVVPGAPGGGSGGLGVQESLLLDLPGIAEAGRSLLMLSGGHLTK